MRVAGCDAPSPVSWTAEATGTSAEARGRWPPPADHLEFFRQLPVWYETAGFLFAHAGLRPGLPPTEQRPEDLLWIRGEFLDSDYDWGKPVVFGHTPWPVPLLTPTRIGLDTGCVYGGKLTCCDLFTRRCWQSG